MATLVQIRDAVDAKLTILWPIVQAKEDSYASAHGGRYWQGLITHSVYPSEGVESLPNIGLTCPSDQPNQEWPQTIRETTMPMALRMDVYDGPQGVGYSGSVYVRVLGTVYSRTAQVGPETWRQVGWHIISEVGALT